MRSHDLRRLAVAAVDVEHAALDRLGLVRRARAGRARGRRRDVEAGAAQVAEERVEERAPPHRLRDPLGRAARLVGVERAVSRRPSTASSSRNCADWNPLAASSRPRNAVNWLRVIVSSTSICATTVLRIVRIRLHRRARAALSPASSRSLQVGELVEQLLEPELVDLVDDDEQQLVVLVGRGRWAASTSSRAR